MRRVLILAGIVLGIATSVLVPSATASATYHGTFTSGSGIHEAPGSTWLPLTGSGDWNLNIGSNGFQLTGMVFESHAPCADSLPPCQFNLPLTAVQWGALRETDDGVVVPGTLQLGSVHFELTFTMAGDSVELRADISGCPYGWTTWVFEGVVGR